MMNQENILLPKVSVAAWKFAWEKHDFCPIFHGSEFSGMCNVVKRGWKEEGKQFGFWRPSPSEAQQEKKSQRFLCFVFFKEFGFEDSGIFCHHGINFFGKKKSLLVNSPQGDLVGLEFKQEVSRAEMSAEENNVDAFWEENTGI